SFAFSLAPAAAHFRIAVLDQRGTGDSGVLRCPSVQKLGSLDPIAADAVADCANRVGGATPFYSTVDSVEDIDTLRAALGAGKVANGPATTSKELSFGLNVITGCEDARLPYALTTPLDQRPALADAAVAALPPAAVAPFDAGTALRTGYVEDCLKFPAVQSAAPSTAPLPDVP